MNTEITVVPAVTEYTKQSQHLKTGLLIAATVSHNSGNRCNSTPIISDVCSTSGWSKKTQGDRVEVAQTFHVQE